MFVLHGILVLIDTTASTSHPTVGRGNYSPEDISPQSLGIMLR
jgi:hypothetical protein